MQRNSTQSNEYFDSKYLKIANNSNVDCEQKCDTLVMQEVAILHKALVAAREGDLQTLQETYATTIPKKQEVCCCCCCCCCCNSTWSNDQYHYDSTNPRNYRVVRHRSEPYDSIGIGRSHYHSPRRRANSKSYYQKALSDSENPSTQRQLRSPASNQRHSHSNSSQITIDSGKESEISSTSLSTSLSSSCCIEPFFLHEPHMTSNDRIKHLFEKEKRNGGHVSRLKEDVINSKNTKYLVTAEIHQISDDGMSLSESSDPAPDYDVDEPDSKTSTLSSEDNQNRNGQSFGIPSISSSEVCSTSTDEGIYQEVEDESTEDEREGRLNCRPLSLKENKETNNSKASAISIGCPNNELKRKTANGFCKEGAEEEAEECEENSSKTLFETKKSLEKNKIIKETDSQRIKRESDNNSHQNNSSSPVAVLPPPPPPPPPPPLYATVNEESDKRCGAQNKLEIEKTERTNRYEKFSGKKCKLPALPFIPPQFSSPPDSDTNIRPSEYLKNVANRTVSAFPVPKYGYLRENRYYGVQRKIQRSVSENHLYDNNDYESIKGISDNSDNEDDDDITSSTTDIYGSYSNVSETRSVAKSEANGLKLPLSPMSTISSITFSVTKEELQKVSLKKTEKTNSNERSVLLTKNDLIAELKATKDLDGIKKVKEQKKSKNEVKEKIAEIANNYSVDNFLDKIPEVDPKGVPVPQWKRHMLAKKAAEKAKKEAEEQVVREIEAKRANAIPEWKKLLKKKEEIYITSPKYIKVKTGSDGFDTTKSEDNSKQKLIRISKTSIKSNIKTTNCKLNNEKQLQEIKFNNFKENDIKEENNNRNNYNNNNINNNNNNQREDVSNPFLKNFQLRKTNSIYW